MNIGYGVLLIAVGAAGLPAGTAGAQQIEPDAAYVAHLEPLDAAAGHEVTGRAWFTIAGDELKIRVQAQGLPPGMVHLQQVHGFAGERVATCPTAEADANGDGMIDLGEAERVAGTAAVRLQDEPADEGSGLDPASAASEDTPGSYDRTFSLGNLKGAIGDAPVEELALDRRVLLILGSVPVGASPAAVASLEPASGLVTLPIACGVIARVQ